jgi:hypothetical protein
MLRIAGGWIIITTDRTAARITWPRQQEQWYILSKAPIPSALLKTKRVVVKYSRYNWTKEWEQVQIRKGTNYEETITTNVDRANVVGNCNRPGVHEC